MANITSKTELAETPADGDLLYLVDVSDTTDNANGSDKKVTRANLVGGLSPVGHTHTESDITDLGTYQTQLAEGAFVNGDKTKLDGIEAGADVTDATNVDSAGAVMNSDTSTLGMSFVVDEDDMVSDLDTKVPTQQSVKAYVTSSIAASGGGDVTGPASATDNAVARFDTTTGKLIQNSSVTISDSGDITTGSGRSVYADYFESPTGNTVTLNGKTVSSASQAPGALIAGGLNGGTGDGGDIKLNPGTSTGGGSQGKVKILGGSTGYATIDSSAIGATDRTITLPDANINFSGGSDGDVLTVQADGSLAIETPAGGGGGQTTYDIIVASTGGDYTTLGEAITNASAGDRILVLDDTTETANISSALAELTIVGVGAGATVTLGTYYLSLTGANVTIENLGIAVTTGYTLLNGDYSQYINCYLSATGSNGSGSFRLYSRGGKFIGNSVYGDTNSTTCYYYNQAINSISSNNYFYIKERGNTSNGCVSLKGEFAVFTNNTMIGWEGTNNAVYITVLDYSIVVSNNVISNYYYCYGVYVNGQKATIAGNNITAGQYGVYCSTGADFSNITGNYLSASNGYGVWSTADAITISGNNIYAKSTSGGYGVYLTAASKNIITGNIVQSAFYGIYLANSTTSYNTITGNNLYGATYPFYDVGTATLTNSNQYTATVDEKAQAYMKNTSGGALSAGDVVILKSVANGNEITTTTTGGDDKVFGVVAESSLANNASGYIQTTGKVTTLKVDGTTDIAVGDYLSTFTTAGIAQKATTGDTVFAVALEAYITDDSNGVIDALLITPRKI